MAKDIQPTSASSGQSTTQSLAIDGQELKLLLEAALSWLKANQQIVNALNVFPVPDGDTGTNMLLTMQAAYNEVAQSTERGVGKMAHGIAQGALMGARGNSGVILSQLWRGFARALDNLDVMDADLLVKALGEARNTAYKGVVRPVEGTILTVAKDIAEAAEAARTTTADLVEILDSVVRAANVSVEHTPELLPILKQAGVVDSGGKGLTVILEGMLRYIKGQPLESSETVLQPLTAMVFENTIEEIEPGQDWELVFDFKPTRELNLEQFYDELGNYGTSIQLGEGDGMYRLHIHVPNEHKYTTQEYLDQVGTVLKIQAENLVAQMEDIESKKENNFQLATLEPGQTAVVAVSPGMGISRIFASLHVHGLVSGGQTMNPSTEEILRIIENLPADRVIILPNNKNIVLAAQTASTMATKKVHVVPSTSVPQGLSAMLRFDPDGDYEEMTTEMVDALKDVDTGEITTATRSIEINGVDVHEGEVIALHNGKLVASADSLDKACLTLLEKAQTGDKERITFFYGENMSKDEVNRIVNLVREAYPSHEIEVHEGGQPHYQFILSIE